MLEKAPAHGLGVWPAAPHNAKPLSGWLWAIMHYLPQIGRGYVARREWRYNCDWYLDILLGTHPYPQFVCLFSQVLKIVSRAVHFGQDDLAVRSDCSHHQVWRG